MENLLKDLRYGVRALLSAPGFTAVAVLSLALGIGVNATIFSVVNSVLLRPLPVADPDELVELYTTTGSEDFPYSVYSYPDYLDIRDNNEVFSGLVVHSLAVASVRHEEASRTVMLEVVSGNFFDVLGIQPALGRTFAPSENDTEGTHPVVVLSHGFWRSQFGADPDLIGEEIRINTTPFTVIGIAPASFTGMLPAVSPSLWIPTMMNEVVSPMGIQDVEESPIGDTRVERRGSRWLFVKGRLGEDVTIERAQANIEALMARLEETYPETNEDRGAMLRPASSVRFHPMIDSALTPVAGLLLGVVGLVLLIACANIANMLLARGSARHREIAVRLALGASRGRLVRQLLTESFLLAGTGGILGFLLSIWATRLALGMDALASLTISFDFGVDFRVFMFALMASVATGLAFGLVPALRASRPQLTAALKGGETIRQGSQRRLGLRDVLVISQIAVSLLLLVGAALLVRSLQAAKAVDLGFDVENVATQEMQLDMIGYSDEQAHIFQNQLLERVRALPEVEAAALVRRLPLSTNISITGVYISGVHESRDDGYIADETYVGPGYFETMGVPLLEGRDFTLQDTPESPRVAIVNETMARTYWPGENVLGKRFRADGLDGPDVEIVGVARDHKVRTVGEEPRPYVHFAHSQQRSTYTNLVARTRGDVSQLVATLRRELNAMEPDLPSGEGSMRESVEVTLLPVSVGAKLLSAFGALAMLLAAMGLYGVISYSVSRRVREVGIRVALGADYLNVIKLVVQRGMVLALIGVVVGAAAAAALSSLLRSVLYGISAIDPAAFAGAAALLLCVAFLANYIPARRAARVDPMIALRNE